MAGIVEFYLAGIWFYRQAGIKRVLSDLRSLDIVSYSAVPRNMGHELTADCRRLRSTPLTTVSVGSKLAAATRMCMPSKGASGASTRRWNTASVPRMCFRAAAA